MDPNLDKDQSLSHRILTSENSWLLEKYVSSTALPNEQIISWLKWDTTLDFDKIKLKSEADVVFERFLNVDEQVFDQEGITTGLVEIDKKLLQIPGFVGFIVRYSAIPEDERELSFIIEFISDNNIVGKIDLITEIIRPKLTILQETFAIKITPYNPTIPILPFTLRNTGKGLVKELDAFLNLDARISKMKIEIKTINEKDLQNEDPIFVPTITKTIQKMFLKGMGMGTITLGFEYEDALHNKYRSNLCTILLDIQQKETIEIPISSIIQGNQSLLLEPKLA